MAMFEDIPGLERVSKMPPRRRKVKSGKVVRVADGHERRRDFLGEAELDRLLAAAKRGRHGARDHLLMLLMFRHGLHSCGFALANKGHDLRLIQDYLGHRDPRHTAHYTRTAAGRFEGLWQVPES